MAQDCSEGSLWLFPLSKKKLDFQWLLRGRSIPSFQSGVPLHRPMFARDPKCSLTSVLKFTWLVCCMNECISGLMSELLFSAFTYSLFPIHSFHINWTPTMCQLLCLVLGLQIRHGACLKGGCRLVSDRRAKQFQYCAKVSVVQTCTHTGEVAQMIKSWRLLGGSGT